MSHEFSQKLAVPIFHRSTFWVKLEPVSSCIFWVQIMLTAGDFLKTDMYIYLLVLSAKC